MKILYIIPARGGSKGILQKNIKTLNGKPLIQYSIEAALNSAYKGRVIVSTDDIQIAKIATTLDVEVPFVRPEELATDNAKSIDVVLHTLSYFQSKNELFDITILLQPTSPLRTAIDINKAIEKLLSDNNLDSVVSVCEAEHHPLWTNILPRDLNMGNFLRPDVMAKNRQELPPYYRLNGAIYACKTTFLIENKTFIGRNSCAYIMPQERSIDIDSIVDFKLAEILLKEDVYTNI